MIKRIYLVHVDIWYFLERASGNLWRTLSRDRASYWLDFLPAFFCGRRYDAERSFFRRFQENLYGQPMRFP